MTETQKPAAVRYPGLTAPEVEASRREHGENLLAPPPRIPWYRQLFAKFDDPVIRILIIAALIAMGTGEFVEGGGILIAVLLATGLAFFNEFRAEKEFDILNRVNDDAPVKAVRDGSFQMIPKREVVVGDVLFIELGEELPADGEVLEAVNLQVDQSRLTGESDPVAKLPADQTAADGGEPGAYPASLVLRGTPVVDGHGFIRVTAVGNATEIGRTATAAGEETEGETPLNRQLGQLSKLVGLVGFSISSITFSALVVHAAMIGAIRQSAVQWTLSGVLLAAILTALTKVWLPVFFDGIELVKGRSVLPSWLARAGWRGWLAFFGAGLAVAFLGVGALAAAGVLPGAVSEWISPEALPRFITFFMIAVTLVVVAVPEGLAMSVTLSLAYSMRKMTAANNLVRKMHACETIGAATVICTDKTGTLTMNQMRVRELHFARLEKPDTDRSDFEFVATALAGNSSANLSRVDPAAPEPIGNPTEGALLLYLESKKADYETFRQNFRIDRQWTFSTERKFMATRGLDADGTPLLHAKGAPEILLGRCASRETAAGIEPLDEAGRKRILDELLNFQARGMRTLGFAGRRNPGGSDELDDVARDLVWFGFAAIADPVRPDVPDAIEACFRAGIEVKMVTGDNPETAREIGRQIRLWKDDEDEYGRIMTGAEYSALSDEEAVAVAAKLRIMARARPNDKLRLVRSLKANGAVVAVTGDGTNDAPALNYADVGIAMGRTGTSIAKEAADIILLDDSFNSIVNAVLWGRSLYRNIQRFILFQLTVNFVALSIAMTGPFLGIELPLTVIQMLWVNLIMDTFAALALATEPPDPEVMKLPPRRSSAFIVTPAMWRGIFGVGAVFLVMLIGTLLFLKQRGLSADPEMLTAFFTAFVMLQFWNLFNAKCFGTSHSVFGRLFDNRAFALIAVGIFLSQIVLVEFGGKAFRTVPMNFGQWAAVVIGTSVIFWGGELFRMVRRHGERR